MPITNKAEAEALSLEELKTELESRGLLTEGLKVGRFVFVSFFFQSGATKIVRYFCLLDPIVTDIEPTYIESPRRRAHFSSGCRHGVRVGRIQICLKLAANGTNPKTNISGVHG